jgi:methyl-accepting chemotaxis protein
MKFISNLKIAQKIAGGYGIIIVFLACIAALAIFSINQLVGNVEKLYEKQMTPVELIGKIDSNINSVRGNLYKYILLPKERPAISQDIASARDEISTDYDTYKKVKAGSDDSIKLQEFEKAWKEFQQAFDEIIGFADAGDTDSAIASISEGGRGYEARTALAKITTSLMSGNEDQAKTVYEDSTARGKSSLIIILVVGVVIILVAFVLSYVITTDMNRPLRLMVNSMNLLSVGDQNRNSTQRVTEKITDRKDEVGAFGRALVGTSIYLEDMSATTARIAAGEISFTFNPHSEKDELGIAVRDMIKSLQSTVSKIKDNALELNQSSVTLAESSTQSDQATSQIAATIQQVARGTSQQSDSVNRTATSIEQLTRAINGVAQGAQEQATAISKASSITAELSDNIQKVAGYAGAVVDQSNQASEAALNGSRIVDDTLAGMQTIKKKVGVSAEKVQEMGSRSDQIGEIVTTIEDIASQTNLLALNAAIEAARAGDAGKGFAVVADEVRKLAERSAVATREIGTLVKMIQKTVTDAVSAMDEGSAEVENGVNKANQAGSALQAIQKATEAVTNQAKLASAAAERMEASANTLVGAVDSVSAVVEENTAATEQMAASAMEVSQSIENIASVSEENSAAVEEVSASAEEMASQVQEVSTSARQLANLADSLQEAVAHFK